LVIEGLDEEVATDLVNGVWSLVLAAMPGVAQLPRYGFCIQHSIVRQSHMKQVLKPRMTDG
jgi:hypothetical protein